jgi:ribosomal protein S18 acetylase RimI-like enzyme
VLIRDARPEDMPAVGEIRAISYLAGNHLSANSEYEPTLRALGADGKGEVLVAVDFGVIKGTVMLQRWPDAGRLVTGPDEAEIRALAVAPASQRAGLGSALLKAVIARAERRGVGHLLLYTQPDMRAAAHLYERAGFARIPERDWDQLPAFKLLAYGMWLAGRPGGGPRE